MTLKCIHIFIVTASFLYWCVVRLASQRFFIHSCIYLRILIIFYLATFLGTNSLSVLMCCKAVNQSILNISDYRMHVLLVAYCYGTPKRLVVEIWCCVHGLLSGDISVVFMWVPSHVELAGNLVADIAVQGMTLNCIRIFIVAGSFLHWCVMRPASQRFFIHSCIYLQILVISYFATFLGTNNLFGLMCRKAVNQSINIAAKAALLLPVSNLTVHHSEYNSLIHTQALKQWQLSLNFETQQATYDWTKGECNLFVLFSTPRWDCYSHVKNWAHISYMWTLSMRGDFPRCLACEFELTVEQILL